MRALEPLPEICATLLAARPTLALKIFVHDSGPPPLERISSNRRIDNTVVKAKVDPWAIYQEERRNVARASTAAKRNGSHELSHRH